VDFLNDIGDYCNRIKRAVDSIDKKQINKFADVLLDHYENDSNIFIFGNGGSGATASHAVCDFNKGICLDLDKKFRFTCLNDNISTVSAYANDISYDEIFCQQLKNYLTPKDLVIAISGSGNSKNIVKAVDYAKKVKADVFVLCGFDGGKLKQIESVNCIHVPVKDMQIVEDCHVIVFHMLMQVLYKHLNR